MLDPKNVGPGEEQYEEFDQLIVNGGAFNRIKTFIQYDYRDDDGELFSCVKATLDLCREAKDAWITKKKEILK